MKIRVSRNTLWYGQFKEKIKCPQFSQKISEYYGECPCRCVVNHAGRIAPHFYEQKNLLLEEQVEFKDDTHVDMKKYRWDC